MGNFLLILLALVLMVTILPIALLYTLVRLIFKKGMSKEMNSWALDISKSLDQLGGVVGKYFFNDLMIKPNGHRFGDEDEVMSSVFGKNKEQETLYMTGKIVTFILNVLDKNHVEKSIEN